VDAQLIHQYFGGAAQIVLGAHFTLPGRPIRGRKLLSPCPIPAWNWYGTCIVLPVP
jgi:hypothetical protein